MIFLIVYLARLISRRVNIVPVDIEMFRPVSSPTKVKLCPVAGVVVKKPPFEGDRIKYSCFYSGVKLKRNFT